MTKPTRVVVRDADLLLPDGSVQRLDLEATDGVITRIARDIEPGDTEYRYPGRTIVPGLIDMHFHPTGNLHRSPKHFAPEVTAVGARAALRALRAGITTVRALGGARRADAALASAIGAGLLPGPHIVPAGRHLAMTGGHGVYNGVRVDGVDGMRRAVRREISEGAAWVKLMCSGGYEHPSESPEGAQFSAAEMCAAVEEAADAGRRVSAHAHGAGAILRAVEAGAGSIEHGNFLDRRAAEAMAQAGSFLIPTFAIYDVIGRREDMATAGRARDAVAGGKAKAFEIALEAGVEWGLGSDAQGGVSHELLLDEIVILHRVVGVGALEVIQRATIGNATLLGLADRTGSIEVGKQADVAVIDGNPVTTIEDIVRVEATMRGGRLYRWDEIAPVFNLWTLEDLTTGPEGVRRTPALAWNGARE